MYYVEVTGKEKLSERVRERNDECLECGASERERRRKRERESIVGKGQRLRDHA